MPQEVSIFSRKEFLTSESSDLQGLLRYRIGTRIGFSYGTTLDNAIKDGIFKYVHRVTDGNVLIKLLISKRVDIVPFDRLGAYYRLKKLRVTNEVIELQPPIQSVPSYIAFSKSRNHAQLRDLFDQVVREMKMDGSYDRLTTYSLAQ